MKTFLITNTFERTLGEFRLDSSDRAVQLSIWTPLSSRNFHWLEVRLKDRVTRIEACRSNPEPDKHEWEWPDSFHVTHEQRGKRTEQEIPRRGTGIYQIELCSVPIAEFSTIGTIRRKTFVSLSFCVGRLTTTLVPTQAEPS